MAIKHRPLRARFIFEKQLYFALRLFLNMLTLIFSSTYTKNALGRKQHIVILTAHVICFLPIVRGFLSVSHFNKAISAKK